MTLSTPLSRMRLVSKMCRLGAWLIAAIGLAVIIYLNFFVFSNLFNDQGGSGLNFNQLFAVCALALLMAIPIFFFSLILAAVGAWLDYMSTEKHTAEKHTTKNNLPEVDDERVEIISLRSLESS